MNFLIIQTAFIGDVILATPVLEKLHQFYPDAKIDVLVKKGNESLFDNHPFINQVIVWNKKENKLKNLWSVVKTTRLGNYDVTINLHRFLSSGIIALLSNAKKVIGFNKNPLSFLFNKAFVHNIGNGQHEVERNLELITDITDASVIKPRLYPSADDFKAVEKYINAPYLCIAPASVWFTKQLPADKWIELINKLLQYKIYLLGAPSDRELCNTIIQKSDHKNIENLSGKLSFLESAALMQSAKMNYVNDSAPMHMASSMNAPVTAIFCSTVPSFGFGPLSDQSRILETELTLDCRPCGLHGHAACPKGTFECAISIKTDTIL